MFIRAYLRASTSEQDAFRAKAMLERFVEDRGLVVASTYVENESGASLRRPELFRLIADSKPGDVLLVEQVDRLSRLTDADWSFLKTEIGRRGIRVVALDLPTSWMFTEKASDPFTDRLFAAVNEMILDVLAAVARKNYDDMRRRQKQGIDAAKAAKRYRGRPEDKARNARIKAMLLKGESWQSIVDLTKASRSTLQRLSLQIKAEAVTRQADHA